MVVHDSTLALPCMYHHDTTVVAPNFTVVGGSAVRIAPIEIALYETLLV